MGKAIGEYFPFVIICSTIDSIFACICKKLISPKIKLQRNLGETIIRNNIYELEKDQ